MFIRPSALSFFCELAGTSRLSPVSFKYIWVVVLIVLFVEPLCGRIPPFSGCFQRVLTCNDM